MSRAKPPGRLVDLSLVAVAMIWGATFVLVKRALADVSTLLFLALRFAAATAALLFVFRKHLRSPNLAYSLRGGVFAGTCLFAGYVLQTFGLKYTSASKTGFITGLYIPLVPLFSSIFYRRVPQIAELAGVAMAFVGLALMMVERDLLSLSLGDILVAGCAVAYAFHMLVLGRYAKAADTGVLAVTQIATAGLLSAATFWWAEPIRIQWSLDVWIALAVTSLLATALAFAVQTWAQRWSSPTRTAVIFSMEPVFAWATSYAVAGELLSRRATVGAGLILAGILMVELRPARLREAQ
ncbi:MAG TPA: DMT family transporter [Bryobacteraceae bacterium]|nr:DMT family transporter [Bryobacteraceae bacterium]